MKAETARCVNKGHLTPITLPTMIVHIFHPIHQIYLSILVPNAPQKISSLWEERV